MTDPQASHHREHHLRTPTNELSHEEKLRRQARHLQILTGVMVLVLAMLVYSAIFDLDNWSEWVVFGAICSVAIGTIIAVSTSG
jgi:membrane protein YdbS with pleckstrin-like domain